MLHKSLLLKQRACAALYATAIALGAGPSARASLATLQDALVLSTRGPASALGQSPTSWGNNTVVSFGGPGLNLGANTTTGTFKPHFHFVPPAEIRALHYVSTSIRVGNPGSDAQLLPGDLLVTFNISTPTTFGTVNNVLRDDVLLYRPGPGGNYTNGTYSMLLEDPIDDGGAKNIHAITLVEKDTQLGNTVLTNGTFLLARSTPSKHMNVYTYRPTSVGPGSTSQGPGQLLLDGSKLGLSNQQIQGLELLEWPAQLGNTNLPAGLLLAAVNGSATLTPGSVNVEPQDVFVLNVSATEQGTPANTVATPALLLDGSNVGLDSGNNDEQINGLSLPTATTALSWAAIYDGPPSSGDELRAMTVDQAGYIYVTGVSLGTASATDCLTIKYSPNGTELWTARYNGPVSGGDTGNAIAVDAAGNVYVTGESRGASNPDFVTLKYDPNGTELWVARYNGPGDGNDAGQRLAVDSSGNVWVTGDSDNDIATVKYSSTGSELWVRRYNGPANNSDTARGIAVDDTGSVYVGGSSAGLTNSLDYTTLKYDSAGNLLWAVAYSGPFAQPDQATALVRDPAGNILLTGYSQGSGSQQDLATVKYDPNGNFLWAERYNGSANGRDEALAMAVDSAGNVIVAGRITDTTHGPQMVTIKYNSAGVRQWVAQHGQGLQIQAQAVAADRAGNVYVAGQDISGGNPNILTLKYGPQGNLIWATVYDRDGRPEKVAALVIDRAANVILAGTSRGETSADDFLTLKYSQPGVPVIYSFSPSLTVFPGETVHLSATLTNTSQPSFQWFNNNAPVVAATNAHLSLTNVSAAHAGAYTLQVSNVLGVILSPTAVLTIQPPQAPVVTTQPQSRTLSSGATLVLSAGYIAGTAATFQWRINGVTLAGATNDTLVITNAAPSHSGAYTLSVQNALGAAESDPAVVQILAAPLPMADAYSNQIAVTNASGVGQAHNTNATVEVDELNHAGNPGGRSVWMTWQPTASGIASFNTLGSSLDTVLAVYTGNTLIDLVEVASDDDSAGFLTSAVQFNAVAGTAYRVVIDGHGGATGNIVFQWALEVTANTLPVILAHPSSGTLIAGTNYTLLAQVTNTTGTTFQWLFNGQTLTGKTALTLTLTNFQATNVGLYRLRLTKSSRSILTRAADLQLNLTGNEAQNARSYDKLFDVVLFGQFLQLGEPRSGEGGSRTLGGAGGGSLARSYSGSQVFSTTGGARQPGEPVHCGIAGGKSSWYGYFCEADGILYLNTDGSNFDTVLAIYTGPGTSFPSLTPVACDNNSGLDGQDSAISFPVTLGNYYFIAVDGVNGASGIVRLNYGLLVPAALAATGTTPGGDNILSLIGQPQGKFEILHSLNLSNWNSLLITNSVSGQIEFIHIGSAAMPTSYYQSRTLP